MESTFLNAVPTLGTLPGGVLLDDGIGHGKDSPGWFHSGIVGTDETCELMKKQISEESGISDMSEKQWTTGTLTHQSMYDAKAARQVVTLGLGELRSELLDFASAVRRDIAETSSRLEHVLLQEVRMVSRTVPAPPIPPFVRDGTSCASRAEKSKEDTGTPAALHMEPWQKKKQREPDTHTMPSLPLNTLYSGSDDDDSPRAPPPRSISAPTVITGKTNQLQRQNSNSEMSNSASLAGRKRLSIETHRRGVAKQNIGSVPASSADEATPTSMTCKHRLLNIVSSSTFDYVVLVIILLNGIMVGGQTAYMAHHMLETLPLPFQVAEISFCVLFTTELGMRLSAYRCSFFTMPGLSWNIFDMVVVILQITEIMMSAVAAGLGFSFTILRVLRLLRIIRLARALRLISELRTIVSSIAGSLKPLFWTGVLLFMVVYVLGVYTTQVVLNKRISLNKEGLPLPHELTLYWGSLMASIFSLFESISGGVDWDDVVRPLIDHISPEMGFLFALYIMFTVLAMLNVVTGVFIEAVMKNAAAENEERTRNGLKHLFTMMDLHEGESIEWPEFEMHLQREEMKEFFRTIDVDIKNAKSLFEVLDTDYSGSLDTDELLDGCLKIWTPCQSLDMQMMRRELNALVQSLQEAGLIASDDPDSPRRGSNPRFE